VDDAPSSPYYQSPAERLEVNVTVAECYLESDAPIDAEVFVGKAGAAVADVDGKEHAALMLRYRSTHARVLDANRKFLQAAIKYQDLANVSAERPEGRSEHGGGGGSMMTYKTTASATIMRVAGSATSAMRKPQIDKRVRNDEA
jgi:COP9 signalosome complex subunit 4